MNTKSLWTPSESVIKNANITTFIQQVNITYPSDNIQDFTELHKWSTDHPERFWDLIWDYTGAIGHKGKTIVENKNDILKSSWFSDSKVNFAENLLKNISDSKQTAIQFWGEDQVKITLSHRELKKQVASVTDFLKQNPSW